MTLRVGVGIGIGVAIATAIVSVLSDADPDCGPDSDGSWFTGIFEAVPHAPRGAPGEV